jgi:hypothetical protein
MNVFKKIVLPIGKYHPLYPKYIKYSFLSNIFSSAQSAIITDNMLYAINTNSETIRTINYIGKDIIGQLGGLIVLSKVGNLADEKPKSFLVYSNIIQQTGNISTCLTPFFPSYFLPIAGISNILSNLSFTGFGAVNAKCIGNMSNNNVGELYSKISLVNTLGSSLGLLLGLCINILIPDYSKRTGIVCILGFLRIYTYNKGIKDLL